MGHKYRLRSHGEAPMEFGARITSATIMCVFILFAVLGNIQTWTDGFFQTILAIGAFSLLIWVLATISYKMSKEHKIWFVFIFIIAFAVRTIMLGAWPIEPSSDFKSTFDAALELSQAELPEVTKLLATKFNYYYTYWPMHVPFILIEMVVLRMFGGSVYALQTFFNIFSALSCVMVGLIAKSLYGRRTGVTAGFIMCFLPPLLVYSAVLSNQHMATFFFLCALYMLIERPLKYRYTNMALASVFAFVSELIRPEMTVFLVAVVCYIIYKNILSVRQLKKLKPAIKKVAISLGIFLGIYLVLTFMTSLVLLDSGFVGNKITNINYRYKVAVGLNAESEGKWNSEDGEYAYNTGTLDELIEQRSQNKLQVIGLGVKKIMNQFGTYDYDWCIDTEKEDFSRKWYSAITNGSMFVIFVLCIAKFIMTIFNRSRREILLLTMLIGYFITYAIIEAQNRYNYFMVPIFVILSSGAIIHFKDLLREYRQKLKEKDN